jgi:hypothetical protein
MSDGHEIEFDAVDSPPANSGVARHPQGWLCFSAATRGHPVPRSSLAAGPATNKGILYARDQRTA